ncbi:hypothetical protein [Providencia sp. CRPN20134]
MGSCAAPSAKGDDKFITTDYLQQCPPLMYGLFALETQNESLIVGAKAQLGVI